MVKEAEAASRRLGLQVQVIAARDASEIDKAFQLMPRARAEALAVLSDPVFIAARTQIVALAVKGGLPSVSGNRQSGRPRAGRSWRRPSKRQKGHKRSKEGNTLPRIVESRRRGDHPPLVPPGLPSAHPVLVGGAFRSVDPQVDGDAPLREV